MVSPRTVMATRFEHRLRGLRLPFKLNVTAPSWCPAIRLMSKTWSPASTQIIDEHMPELGSVSQRSNHLDGAGMHPT